MPLSYVCKKGGKIVYFEPFLCHNKVKSIYVSEGVKSFKGWWKMDIFDVAKYFRCKVDIDAGSVMTHLKLQKLVYYAQAWHLALYDEPLVESEFRAWAHGPVNYELYNEYRDYGADPIGLPTNFSTKSIPAPIREHLDDVWDTYGKYDAKYLEDMTHAELPWKEARGELSPWAACNVPIKEETMKQFYRSLKNDE